MTDFTTPEGRRELKALKEAAIGAQGRWSERPLSEATLYEFDIPATVLSLLAALEEAEGRERALRGGLIKAIQLAERAVRIAEDDGNHDAGAYDASCAICVELEKVRDEISGIYDEHECVERAALTTKSGEA